MAPIALLSAVLTVAICAKAIDFDLRAGLMEAPLPLGQSIILADRMPLALSRIIEVVPAPMPDEPPEVALEVTAHPGGRGVYGATNRGTDEWTVTFRDGRLIKVAPARTVRIANGALVDFGPVRRRVEASTAAARG